MTAQAALRAERRRARAEAERRARAEALGAVAFLLAALLAFGLAGSLDYRDRTQGLGASMLPDPAWAGAGPWD